jgi:hypothetical protein
MISSRLVAAGSPSKAAWASRRELARPRRAFAQAQLAQFRGALLALAAVTEAMFDLALDLDREHAHHLAHVLAQIVTVEIGTAKVTGIHEIQHQAEDIDDGVARRQIVLGDVQCARIGLVTAEQLQREPLQRVALRFGRSAHVQATACIFSTSSNSPSNSGPLK